MHKGLALAFLSYALFAWCDATIKSLGGELPVLEIVFFSTLFCSVAIFFLKPRDERWRNMFRMKHPKWVALRALCGITAGIAGTYAYTTIPLAEAYALVFLAPIFVTLLSIPILGEPVGWRRLSAVAVGFVGLVLIVKPGFRELLAGHLAALIVAVAGATSMIVLRKIGQSERQVSLIGMVMLSVMAVSGALMIPEFTWPSLDEFLRLALVGVFGGGAQMTLMAAARHAPANRVAPAQYSQILWAVVLGAAIYSEVPDWIGFVGIGLIGLSGLFTLLREDKVGSLPRRTEVLGDWL